MLIASDPEAAWQGGIALWFEQHASSAWQHERPTAVVAPTRGQLNAIKARLLASGHSTLGLQFLTPPYLRTRLCSDLAESAARGEHLRLLLSFSAEEELASSQLSEAERLAAISVQRTPNHLLNLLERLSAGGIDFEDVDLAAFRPVVRTFRRHQAEVHFALAAEADRAALNRAAKSGVQFRALLLTGFHGAHWPQWHLLRAAAQSAEQCTVLLQHPREGANDLDAAWIGSWEETFGEAQVLDAIDESVVRQEKLFLTGLDAREQAEAVVAAAHRFLAAEECTRLGILFPAAGALSRLVATALTRQGIPHYDAMGQMAPGIFEEPVFENWMELQRTPRLAVLIRFLNALEHDHPLFEKISRRAIAGSLQKALGTIAIDDLTTLIAYARGREGKGELISAALAQVHLLPARATFAEFLAATHDAFAQLGWHERWRALERQATWSSGLAAPFSRTLYLRWVDEVAVDFRLTRDAIGAHPYARVHLLTPAQAEDQAWSHLIMTSLNDGLWPAAPGGDFLPAPQIESLNESMRNLNRAAVRRGRQGEGHVAVREGRALIIGAAQQRQLAEAQFTSLLANTRHGVAFTASVIQEDAPERISNPSEFLNRAYHEAHGHSLSQQQMRALRSTTREWLDAASLEPRLDVPVTREIEQTRIAYDARRVVAESDEYDFALRAQPAAIAPISVSALEEVLKSPGIVWLRRYLGVEGEEDLSYAWENTTGKWTHEWLASLSERREGFVAAPSPEEIERRIRSAAERKRTEVQLLCRQAGRQLPDWWESAWQGALCVSLTLGRLLAGIKGWPWMATEWRLDSQPIDVGEDLHLLLTGRADLLFAQTSSAPVALDVPALWIIDFKTGNKHSLTRGLSNPDVRLDKVRQKVIKGEALQLALYAHAVRQLGAENVHVSLLSPLASTAEPQLSLDDFENCAPALRELARMQATGVFGFKGSLRNAYAYTKPYPLATLAIDRDIADERWELTHPDLASEGNYWR